MGPFEAGFRESACSRSPAVSARDADIDGRIRREARFVGIDVWDPSARLLEMTSGRLWTDEHADAQRSIALLVQHPVRPLR